MTDIGFNSFPNWTMDRLLSEAAASWSIHHEPIDARTGDWPALYNAALCYLRHLHSCYDQELHHGADRDALHQAFNEAARAKYPWLRLSRDPRQPKVEPEAVGLPRRIFADRSKRLSDLISKKDHLFRARSALKREWRSDYKVRCEAINSELRQLEAQIADLLEHIQCVTKPSESRCPGVDMQVHCKSQYLFGGRTLPENYTRGLSFKCPARSQTVCGTKRPIDLGAGVWLNSFSCHCLSVNVQRGYTPYPAIWERFLDEPWPTLSRYHDDLVLIGGLAIHYLTRRDMQGLPGAITMDVDFGVSVAASGGQYGTIKSHLEGLGFVSEVQRLVRRRSGIALYIDFLTEDSDRNALGSRVVDDVKVAKRPAKPI